MQAMPVLPQIVEGERASAQEALSQWRASMPHHAVVTSTTHKLIRNKSGTARTPHRDSAPATTRVPIDAIAEPSPSTYAPALPPFAHRSI